MRIRYLLLERLRRRWHHPHHTVDGRRCSRSAVTTSRWRSVTAATSATALPGRRRECGSSSLDQPVPPGPRPSSRAALLRTTQPAAPTRMTGSAPASPRAHDRALRRYVAAQDDCVVVGTRMSLNLALADLRTDRQVAVAQEHNHLAQAPEPCARRTPPATRGSTRLVVLTEGDAAAVPHAARRRAAAWTSSPNALPHGIRLRRSPLDRDRWRSSAGLARQAQGLRPARRRVAAGRSRAPRVAPADLRRRRPGRRAGLPGSRTPASPAP